MDEGRESRTEKCEIQVQPSDGETASNSASESFPALGPVGRRRTKSLPSRQVIFAGDGSGKPMGTATAAAVVTQRSVAAGRSTGRAATLPYRNGRESRTEDRALYDRGKSIVTNLDPKTSTIRQHYYPEGGWGWVICVCAFFVHFLTSGLQLSYGVLYLKIVKTFGKAHETAWIGSLSLASGFFLSPVIVALCRRKSTRLIAVFGGFISALGCLFTSFASQIHQIFFSYGIFMGFGLGIAREASNIMIGQYFKRRREFVELIVQSGTGLGITMMSLFLHEVLRLLDWRLGLQALTGIVFTTFFLGVCYRPASLYHPQRRAILHLKNQKRKIKDKTAPQEKSPFLDFSLLRTRTLQIVMLSSSLCSLGIYTPCFYMAIIADEEGLENSSVLILQALLGLAFAVGCLLFGLMIIKSSPQCMIARQYLCQAAMFGTAVAILSLRAVSGYQGYILFVWIYGIFCGGFHYSLKMYLFEKVRPRNFSRSWGFLQWSQFLSVLCGIPITGYINRSRGPKMGVFFSCGCVVVGMLVLFLMNLRKTSDKKSQKTILMGDDQSQFHIDATIALNEEDICTCGRNLGGEELPPLDRCQKAISFGTSLDGADEERRPELLTCISEEGLVDIGDNNILEEWCMGECITSCNKEEKFLMISEFENNLHDPVIPPCDHRIHNSPARRNSTHPELFYMAQRRRCDPVSLHLPKRKISVIEEITSSV
ncbi:monocarboxylate transporter 10-like [Limulus polyphemus]|uniref:Monocarboxylate transporter 10-like n=1 Tax=Limulus polyphemus TaxID=6850 RepID=A0ABM1BQR4_LIMPO|nr:monocarboxylate transporter 10-like [Limulus polyphemus]